MTSARQPQLEYSVSQALMLDEESRRRKARKMVAVLRHFLGRDDLDGLTVIDVGCSGGIVLDELRIAGARAIGTDIDRPGLTAAHARFGESSSFVLADSQAAPLATACADLVICNHVYEHVVDPWRLFTELRRIVRPEGALYLGLGNRLGMMEPHYRLPFLSWLPRSLAHRYIRLSGRADHYHEAFMTRRGLRRLCAGLDVWDYTEAVLRDPGRFSAADEVPAWVARAPRPMLRLARPIVPTYLWVATPLPSRPAGPALPLGPDHVDT